MAENYDTGTITLTNGSRAFVGVGTSWIINGVVGGVLIVPGNYPTPIEVISTDLAGLLKWEWAGPSGTYAYTILRADAAAAKTIEATDRLAEIVKRLYVGSFLQPGDVGDTAGRSANDAKPKGFVYWRVDVVPFQVSIKRSSTSGDWSGWTTLQGPAGATGSSGEGERYDIPVRAVGQPGSAEDIVWLLPVRAIRFPAGMSDSRAEVRIAPASDAVFSMTKNDVEFATITFLAGETLGIFECPVDTEIAPDQRFDLFGPNPRDLTLEDFTATLAAERIA